MFFPRGYRVSRRRGIFFICDGLCVGLSIMLAALLRVGMDAGWHYLAEHVPSLVGSGLIFLLVFYAGGMYERSLHEPRAASLQTHFVLTLIGLVLIILTFYARFELSIGRGILILAGLFVFLGTWAVRRVVMIAAGYGFFSRNALVLGEGDAARQVVQLLSSSADTGYRMYGVVSCTQAVPGEFLEGLPVLGKLEKLREFVEVYEIETIIVATSLAREHSLLRVLRPLRYGGVEILDYAGLYEHLAMEIPVEHIDDEWLMHAAMNSSRIHIRKLKRIMDVSVALIGLLLSAPICLLAAALVKLNSSGPVLYRQRRAGLDGVPYTLMKFRTMKQDAEAESGAVWAGKYDTRVTSVGLFLRKWRIDEIPQLINVLRGEMSLVGPRPERPEFIDQLAGAIPHYKERLLVPPGITGWAQVKYPYAASVEASKRKLQYDLYYIKNMSFFLDVTILLLTFRTILEGIRYGEEYKDQSAEAIREQANSSQSLRVLSPSETAREDTA